MSWQTDSDAALLGIVLKTFDHAPVWKQAKPPHETATVVGHVKRFGSKEGKANVRFY